MQTTLSKASLLIAASVGLAGCVTNPTVSDAPAVQYGDSKAVETVSNEFGSTDLQSIAETMSRSLTQFAATAYKDRPLVTVAEVKNKTSEYIDTRSVTDSIKTQVIKGGTLRFVTDIAQMQNQTDELARQNQSGMYKKSTAAKTGQMQAAKYRIEGTITSIVKRGGDVKDVYYKFTLQMFDIESGITEWMDEREIRKTSRK